MVISLRNILSLLDHRHNKRDLRTRQASCPHLPWHSEVPMCPPTTFPQAPGGCTEPSSAIPP